MKKCLLCGQDFVLPVPLLRLFSRHGARASCICGRCLARFRRLPQKRCRVCSGQLEDGQAGMCADCVRWQNIYGSNLLHNQALYRYNEAFHDLMVRYKRYGDYVLRHVLQELCYRELHKRHADFYVPVPTSPEHSAKRQFDTVSAIFGDLVHLTPILGKKPGGGAQGEKTRRERLESQQNFFVKERLKFNLNNHKVLLLDDIYTTGRTLYHARDALAAVFPKARIMSFSICR